MITTQTVTAQLESIGTVLDAQVQALSHASDLLRHMGQLELADSENRKRAQERASVAKLCLDLLEKDARTTEAVQAVATLRELLGVPSVVPEPHHGFPSGGGHLHLQGTFSFI